MIIIIYLLLSRLSSSSPPSSSFKIHLITSSYTFIQHHTTLITPLIIQDGTGARAWYHNHLSCHYMLMEGSSHQHHRYVRSSQSASSSIPLSSCVMIFIYLLLTAPPIPPIIYPLTHLSMYPFIYLHLHLSTHTRTVPTALIHLTPVLTLTQYTYST